MKVTNYEAHQLLTNVLYRTRVIQDALNDYSKVEAKPSTLLTQIQAKLTEVEEGILQLLKTQTIN